MNNTSDFFFLFFDLNRSDVNQNVSNSHRTRPWDYHNLGLVERLTIYLTFILSVIGIIGNMGTILVLNQQTMRKWRSSILLSALAIVDFLYLSVIFLSIVDQLTDQSIGFHRSLILCQSTVYITHICSFLSSNFTLSFTLQRFVAVLFPLHAQTIISTRSSIINISFLVLFSSSFYSFSFFLTNLSQDRCREDESYPALFPLLIVDICLTFVLPLIFILLFNIAIVYKLQTRKKFTDRFGKRDIDHFNQIENVSCLHLETTTISTTCRSHSPRENCQERQHLYPHDETNVSSRRMTATRILFSSNKEISRNRTDSLTHPRLSTPTISYDVVTPNNSSNRHQTISQRTTKMLLICSTTFLIFNSPYCIVLFYSVISKHVLTRTLDILRYFYFMSFCLNFFLYSLCGNRFRHELVTIFKRCCSNNLRQNLFHFEKIPPQSSLSRTTVRTGV